MMYIIWVCRKIQWGSPEFQEITIMIPIKYDHVEGMLHFQTRPYRQEGIHFTIPAQLVRGLGPRKIMNFTNV